MRPVEWLSSFYRKNLLAPALALAALLAPSAIAMLRAGSLPLELTPAGDAAAQAANRNLTLIQLASFDIGLTLAVVSGAMLIYRWRPMRLFLHLALFAVLMELFYRIVYHGPMTAGVMFSIAGTSPREAGELLSAHPVLTGSLFLTALLMTYAAVVSWAIPNPFRTAWCVRLGAVSALLLMASLALSWRQVSSVWMLKQVIRAEVTQNFPFDFGNSIRRVAEYSVAEKKYAAARAAFSFKNVRMREMDSRSNAPEIYVVIVGESARRSHWSLFGYPRSTTPNLDAIRNDLVAVDHLTSNATVTALSVAQALSRASPASWWKASSEKSIVALLRQAGFTVHWISNQERFGAYASLISNIALEANSASYLEEMPQSIQTDRFDSNLLTRMDKVLKKSPEHGKTVIFLHMMGSHLNYSDRYPAKFDVFHEPTEAHKRLPDRQRRLVDQYDNSLRFTDHILRGVIDRLENCRCNSAMVYFSDHGERLFDGENESGADFGHGFSTISREEIAIPFFIWMSPQYQAAHASSVATLRENSHDRAQLHNLFETLVDLAGVDYQGRTDTLSIFSSKYQEPRNLEVLSIGENPVSLPPDFGDSAKERPFDGATGRNDVP